MPRARPVGGSRRVRVAASVSAFVTFVALMTAFVSLSRQSLSASDDNDWPAHDHDAGAQRFSPLKQITPANVAALQTAWTFDTGISGLQVTPLVVNGIMYATAGKDIIALEPETARVIWRYTALATVSRRGVAYWPGDRGSLRGRAII